MIKKLRKDVQDGECFKYDPPLAGTLPSMKGFVAYSVWSKDLDNLPTYWLVSNQTAHIEYRGSHSVIMLEHYSTHPAGVPKEERRPSFEDDCGACGRNYGRHYGMNCDADMYGKLGARLFTPALKSTGMKHYDKAGRYAAKPFVTTSEEMRAETHASRLRAEEAAKKRDLAEEERLVTVYSEGMRREGIRKDAMGRKYIPPVQLGDVWALTATEFERAAALFSARVSAKVAKTDAEEKERARTVVVVDRDEDYWP